MSGPERTIPYVNLAAQFSSERDSLMAVVERVLSSGDYVGGAVVGQLEQALSDLHGGRAAVALHSGTDALMLGMKALGIGPGDEVITPPNSFVASTAAIVAVGATPVFADVLPDQNIDPEAVRKVCSPRTKAIMAVHLTGRVAAMPVLADIARQHGAFLIEDAAQAIGSRLGGELAGTFGDIACFSTHPLKNLNAAGDGGFLLAKDPAVALRVSRLRNHGMIDRETVAEWGTVSRLDSLQAAILLDRLSRLDAVIERRRANAQLYQALLQDLPVFMPPCQPDQLNTFHTFVVQVDDRQALRDWLAQRGVMTAIHYPVPLHLQPAAQGLGYGPGDFPIAETQSRRILTLPVNQSLNEADIAYVAQQIRDFYQRQAS